MAWYGVYAYGMVRCVCIWGVVCMHMRHGLRVYYAYGVVYICVHIMVCVCIMCVYMHIWNKLRVVCLHVCM